MACLFCIHALPVEGNETLYVFRRIKELELGKNHEPKTYEIFLNSNTTGKCNTSLSAYLTYRHLEYCCTHQSYYSGLHANALTKQKRTKKVKMYEVAYFLTKVVRKTLFNDLLNCENYLSVITPTLSLSRILFQLFAYRQCFITWCYPLYSEHVFRCFCEQCRPESDCTECAI